MAKRKTPSSLQPPPQHQHPSAGLLRRLGALLYDYLVVIALLIIAGFIGMGVSPVSAWGYMADAGGISHHLTGQERRGLVAVGGIFCPPLD